MLMTRMLTAGTLIAIILAGILLLPYEPFLIVSAAFILIGAWEWSQLLNLPRFLERIIYVVAVYIAIQLSYVIFHEFNLSFVWLFFLSVAWWLFMLPLVHHYPQRHIFWRNNIWQIGLMGLMTLVPFWYALIFLERTPYILLYAIALVSIADSAAYFTGHAWGKEKLLPRVSPKKTKEGLYGSLLVTGLFSLVVIVTKQFISHAAINVTHVLIFFLLSITTVLFSVLGDLFESMLKRNVDIKDSGNILPGHGGILDRIDSLSAALPVFALGYYLFF